MSAPTQNGGGGRDGEPTLIERIFIAIINGEPAGVLELIHPHAEWTPTVWSGEQTYKGREGVGEWLGQFGGNLEYLDIRVEKVQVGGDRGAVQGTVFDSREGGMFAVRVSWSFQLEDGLMYRGQAHDSWDEALRSAGLAQSAER